MSIYLDNSATTMQDEKVTQVMLNAVRNTYGNPSSLHRAGMEAEKLVKQARKTISRAIGAAEDEIFFTSGGTESDNTAIFGAALARRRAGKHIITGQTEHPAVLESCKRLQELGFDVTYLAPDVNGAVSADDVKKALRDDTILVSVMHVNNETGTVQPVEEIGALLKKREKTLFHCDAVQSFGKLPIDVHSAGIDLLAASSHKIHGPKGMGALFVSGKTHIVPLMYGGGQEKNVRPGTENVPAIAGFAAATELARENMGQNIKHVTALRDRLAQRLRDEIPDMRINSPLEKGSLPYILNVSFLHTRAEVLLHMLEESGIYVSTGSACSSNKKNRGSHVLRAMELEEPYVEGAVRISFSHTNTMEQIEETADRLAEAVKKNRKMLALTNRQNPRRS